MWSKQSAHGRSSIFFFSQLYLNTGELGVEKFSKREAQLRSKHVREYRENFSRTIARVCVNVASIHADNLNPWRSANFYFRTSYYGKKDKRSVSPFPNIFITFLHHSSPVFCFFFHHFSIFARIVIIKMINNWHYFLLDHITQLEPSFLWLLIQILPDSCLHFIQFFIVSWWILWDKIRTHRL